MNTRKYGPEKSRVGHISRSNTFIWQNLFFLIHNLKRKCRQAMSGMDKVVYIPLRRNIILCGNSVCILFIVFLGRPRFFLQF